MYRGRQSVYNIVGVHGIGETPRTKERSSKGRNGWSSWEGMFPPLVRGSGERCKLPDGVRGEAAAI